MSYTDSQDIVKQFAELTTALTSEKDHIKLLDRIILGCMSLTNADGGTLYTQNEENENELKFTILHNQSLGIHRKPRDLPVVEIHNAQQQASKLVVAQTFVKRETINIPDAYLSKEFDFSGTRKFDKQLSYRSKSFLCVPLKDHEGVVIGVLQLINALDHEGNITDFTATHERIVESLASLAATVLTKRKLIDAQRLLFESFIKLIGRAIDHKSPVTGKHCEQVPEIAMLLAEAINSDHEGFFSSLNFSDSELYELRIAAWLHDCGKITTPEYIIDKATKLHTMFDRIKLIESRFREYKLHLQLELMHKQSSLTPDEFSAAKAELCSELKQRDHDLDFIRTSNTGSEFMSEEDQARILSIAEISWVDSEGELQRLIEDDELENLCINKGTLTDDERQVMRDHIKVTIDMLESLNYPRQLKNVPEIACSHHEHMDGSGYPRGLKEDELSIRARIMCIADVFEALTSPDRPYKKGMLLSQAMTILGNMVKAGHLDKELFKLFVKSEAYLQYAKRHMTPRQIDPVDLHALPGLNV